MPNHVTHLVTVTGPEDDLAAFEAAHICKDLEGEVFDFATVVFQPEIVNKTKADTESEKGFYALTGLVLERFSWGNRNFMLREEGFEVTHFTTFKDYAAWLGEHKPHVLEKGKVMVECFRQTGYMSWYDWNAANWGTKWNAYGFSRRDRAEGKIALSFDTAWSVPEPIFSALADRYPNLSFFVESIDECGQEYESTYCGDQRACCQCSDAGGARYVRVMGRAPYKDDESELQ
jgi:hypothetical protein